MIAPGEVRQVASQIESPLAVREETKSATEASLCTLGSERGHDSL